MKNIVFDVPNGPENLKSIFPEINWSQVQSYSVSVLTDDLKTLAKSNNVMGCCCNDEKIRIHFINYLGRVDAINFTYVEETFEAKSDTWQKSLNYPLTKSDGGTRRINIKSNESYKATNKCYSEEDMNWIKELLSSPIAWLEWKGTEDQPDDYIPIEIIDKKFLPLKNEERYKYEVGFEFKMANENIHLRN